MAEQYRLPDEKKKTIIENTWFQVYLPVDIVWDGEEVTTCIKMEADWVTDIFSQVRGA